MTLSLRFDAGPFPKLSRRELLLRAGAAPLVLLAGELTAAEEQLADPKKLRPASSPGTPSARPTGRW
jgi:hypothetical protein